MPTFRIMKTAEFPDAIFYRASCDCGSRECDLSLMLEHDPRINDITLTIYQDLRWNAYWEPRWYLRPWLRLKVALRVLLTGFIQVESSFLFGDREQINAFVQALNEGMEKLELEEIKTYHVVTKANTKDLCHKAAEASYQKWEAEEVGDIK